MVAQLSGRLELLGAALVGAHEHTEKKINKSIIVTPSSSRFKNFGLSMKCHYDRVVTWTPYDQKIMSVKS